MWVLVSYNRCLYQDGDWREDHFAELENGMFIVYAVSRAASGTISRVKSLAVDELEITVMFDDESGASRSVVLLTGSPRSRDLWTRFLSESQTAQGAKDTVKFESVAIKSPTKDESATNPAAKSSPHVTTRKRESLTGQWDALTSYMGAWHRRLFRFFEDGSIVYCEVAPVACVSLSSASSLLCLESGPRSTSEDGRVDISSITFTSSFGDAALPKPPAEVLPPLTHLSRRLSRAVGSFTAPKADEVAVTSQGWNNVVSSVTIGSPSSSIRDDWVSQIRLYCAWFVSETLADTIENRRAKVITKGWGWKRGQLPFSSWKLRFFVLLSSRELFYYDAEMGREPLGMIDLKKKRQVRLGRSNDKPQGFEEIIEIETPSRTWYFSPKAMNRGEHSFELSNWMQAISDSNENFEKHHSNTRRSTFTEYSSTSFFVPPHDVSLAADKALPIVKLNSWQRMTGNVPSTLLSPSPAKAEFLMNGVVGGESVRRKSFIAFEKSETGLVEADSDRVAVQL